MTDIAVRVRDSDPFGALQAWAQAAECAARLAVSLAKTSFVPASLRGKPEDITAAILAGQELGLPPMASLRSIDVIQGTPALRAHAMRGLVQSRGHSVQLVESTGARCVMRGRRAGDDAWQQVEWTIDRAASLGLTGKPEWKKQPATMLVARATGEICRLIAADVLHAMPYATEEVGDIDNAAETVTRVTAAEIVQGLNAPRRELPETSTVDTAAVEPVLFGDDWPDVAQPAGPR